jgi:RNA polymerase sigma-70 factor (ECF subfamily)
MMEQSEDTFEPADEKSHVSIELSAEARRVIQALQELSEDFREVLYLRYVEDLEPQEIARILGISANLASVRMSRGMDELRKIMRTSKVIDSA